MKISSFEEALEAAKAIEFFLTKENQENKTRPPVGQYFYDAENKARLLKYALNKIFVENEFVTNDK